MTGPWSIPQKTNGRPGGLLLGLIASAGLWLLIAAEVHLIV